MPDEKQQKSRLEILEETVAKHQEQIDELLKRPFPKKQLFGGKAERNPTVDTETGKVYISKSALGKSLAVEFELDPADKFVWYKIRAKAPDRFRDATEAEAKKAIEEEDAKVAANIAKAEAEEKAKAAAPAAKEKKGAAKPGK